MFFGFLTKSIKNLEKSKKTKKTKLQTLTHQLVPTWVLQFCFFLFFLVFSMWKDINTSLDIIEKYRFSWKIGDRRTLTSLLILYFWHVSTSNYVFQTFSDAVPVAENVNNWKPKGLGVASLVFLPEWKVFGFQKNNKLWFFVPLGMSQRRMDDHFIWSFAGWWL